MRTINERAEKEGSVCEDPTTQMYRLAVRKQKFFLLCPRCSGQSRLLLTFASLFRDGIEDFRGLAIEKLWKDTTYDVVTLDFSRLTDVNDLAAFRTWFDEFLVSRFGAVGFEKSASSDLSVLAQLDVWLQSRKLSSLVLLINEYDAPFSTHLKDKALFDDVRNLLNEFYSRLKSCEGCLRFLFVTGAAKFDTAALSSPFDQVIDISDDPQYGSFLGKESNEKPQ